MTTVRDTLLILPMLRAFRDAQGRPVLTGKFVSGVAEYARHWDGPIHVVMELKGAADNNLDHVPAVDGELPFRLTLGDCSPQTLNPLLPRAAVVLASVGWTQNHVSALCRAASAPCVYVAEHSLLTRKQMVRAGTRNPVLRMRRTWWHLRQERLHRQAIAIADGIQCNGTPAFEEYRAINPAPLLYFDTRVRADELAKPTDVTQRASERLQLFFSGRFTGIKGVDHLPAVAAELAKLGIAFDLHLCGDGELRESMQADCQRLGVTQQVHFHGNLDFHHQLLPLVRRQADLFVCPHRQGDPSCTYLETMGCGVPIVGYDNQAFAGVVRESGCGWVTPLDRPALLARQIARLAPQRDRLRQAGLDALAFAAEHTFEATFARRIDHLRQVSQAPQEING